ncbi:putative zinc-binding peptidase [Hyphomicrobium sp. 802]|uniref:zinc-binding metallopeptidase family protein n=1 Tax=Hyphomicrobium sp. 802 TaxID=1112272 RepID=UPI00045EA3E7|nr:putative zinc-binding peptidase [Hyphomicrobium sp. 802]
MKLFECQNCGQVLFFENTHCERCHLQVGYLPPQETMSAVKPNGSTWIALADNQNQYRYCANWELHACNWLVNASSAKPYCSACEHNRTVPDLSDPINVSRWHRIEEAKRRLMYTLLRLRLPVPTTASGDPEPLLFDFLASAPQAKVLTGHDNGIITISLLEADDAEREKLRTHLHEPYRTLLGHFRHEVGHYYWDRLVRDAGKIEAFREVFGDETLDYDAALQAHYQNGAPANWRENFVSAYATMHPWEDFAETWAHYLHIIDTLEMAHTFNLRISPRLAATEGLSATADRDPYAIADMETLMSEWIPVTFAVNSLNRSMGQPDLYPFVLSPAIIGKLAFIHRLVKDREAETERKSDEEAASPRPGILRRIFVKN